MSHFVLFVADFKRPLLFATFCVYPGQGIFETDICGQPQYITLMSFTLRCLMKEIITYSTVCLLECHPKTESCCT